MTTLKGGFFMPGKNISFTFKKSDILKYQNQDPVNYKPLIAAGVIAGGVYLFTRLSKASAVQNLVFRLSNVKIGWEGISPTLELTIMVGNTSNTEFTVNALAGSIYVNNYPAGAVQSFTKTVVAATSESPFKLKIKVGLAGIGKQIIDIIQGKAAIAADIRFVGTTNVDGLIFPLDVSYKIV